MDKIILGHNQFFGVNHFSSIEGMKNEKKFSNIDNSIDLIEFSQSEGATGMMLSTHENSIKILNKFSEKKNLNNMNIHILMPYMNKYVRRLNQIGIIPTLNEVLLKNNNKKFLNIMEIGKGVLTKDIYSILKVLIDTEIRPYLKFNIKSIFLHNSLTDILSSFGLIEIIEYFYSYITRKYKLDVGFCTLNYPLLHKVLEQNNFKNLNIMLPFNKIGFQMSPSREDYEKLIISSNFNYIAMSTMAGGRLSPDEAFSYISNHNKIRSIILGSSKIQNIKSSFASIKKHIY